MSNSSRHDWLPLYLTWLSDHWFNNNFPSSLSINPCRSRPRIAAITSTIASSIFGRIEFLGCVRLQKSQFVKLDLFRLWRVRIPTHYRHVTLPTASPIMQLSALSCLLGATHIIEVPVYDNRIKLLGPAPLFHYLTVDTETYRQQMRLSILYCFEDAYDTRVCIHMFIAGSS